MELREFLALLRRWWWLILVCALLGGGVALFVDLLRTPVYQATTTVLINQAPGAMPDPESVWRAQQVSETYAELMRRRPVLEEVVANLGLSVSPASLAGRVGATRVGDTNLLEITVTDTDPQRAADIANEIVRVFIEQNIEFQAGRYAESLESLKQEMDDIQEDIDRTQQSLDALEFASTPAQIEERNRLENLMVEYQSNHTLLLDRYSGIRSEQARTTDKLSVVESALPGTPVRRVNARVTVLQGLIVGIALAVGIVLLAEYLRVTVSSGEEAERITSVPTLAIIPDIKGNGHAGTLTATRPRSPMAETYRVLRANIDFAVGENPIRTVVITSARPLEGKTSTAANLATAIAQAGKRTILVDADLRRPSLHKLFQQTNVRGVTTALQQEPGSMVSGHVASTSVDNLYLMPSGPLPPNPADLLGSQHMVELVQELGQHAEFVIFDTPPLLAVVDAHLLARMCDATLLVVRAKSTRADMLRRARDQVLQSGANLVGVVLNRVSASRDGYYYSSSYSSGAE